MTLVSSKEFSVNQDRYFDLAKNEDVFIKRNENRYRLVYEMQHPEQEILEPDEDFYRAITMEELRKRVLEDVHQWYKERNECNSNT